MNTLRRLLLPRDDGGATYLDHDGNAVIRADQVATASRTIDDTIDRLVLHLARAAGRSEAEIRLSEGLNQPDPHTGSQNGPNGRPTHAGGAVTTPHRPTTRATPTGNTRQGQP